MSSVRERGERIRQFVIANVEQHPQDIAKVTAKRFAVTRQAIKNHLARLVDEGVLSSEGQTRARTYKLCPLDTWRHTFVIDDSLAEDRVWTEHVAPHLTHLSDHARRIWQYGFTEMFNNAIDHSEGTSIGVTLTKTAASTSMLLVDDGIGIFRKIRESLNLIDERHAVLELAKGKLTTDPARHTGEGIFFTSRMFDDFAILSGETFFSHDYEADEDWIVQAKHAGSGTTVTMKLNNHTSRTTKKVFDRFASDDDMRFNRTIVPVRLAQYGDELLVSRSQAKRLLERVDRFDVVVFDFAGVEEIGQAFADEVFRVFAAQHPQITLETVNDNAAVRRMIGRATGS